MGVRPLTQRDIRDHSLKLGVIRFGERLRQSLADLPLQLVTDALDHDGDVDAAAGETRGAIVRQRVSRVRGDERSAWVSGAGFSCEGSAG